MTLLRPLDYDNRANNLIGGDDVQQEGFTHGQRPQHRGIGVESLEFVKSLLCLEHPHEALCLLEKAV